VSIHLWASLVPAAAVIPAQVAYFDVVAVKKLVVGWHPREPRKPHPRTLRPGGGAETGDLAVPCSTRAPLALCPFHLRDFSLLFPRDQYRRLGRRVRGVSGLSFSVGTIFRRWESAGLVLVP